MVHFVSILIKGDYFIIENTFYFFISCISYILWEQKFKRTVGEKGD